MRSIFTLQNKILHTTVSQSPFIFLSYFSYTNVVLLAEIWNPLFSTSYILRTNKGSVLLNLPIKSSCTHREKKKNEERVQILVHGPQIT